MNLAKRLEQVDKLRKQALQNPEFISSAEEHEEAIINDRNGEAENSFPASSDRRNKPKKLSDVFTGGSYEHQTND